MEECHEERRENYRLPESYVHKQRYTRKQSLEGLIRRRYIVLFGYNYSDLILRLDVFLKETPAPDVYPSYEASTSAKKGT